LIDALFATVDKTNTQGLENVHRLEADLLERILDEGLTGHSEYEVRGAVVDVLGIQQANIPRLCANLQTLEIKIKK